MQITITNNSFTLNGVEMSFPLDIQQLKTLLGEARHVSKKYNHIYTWDALGLLAYSKNGAVAEDLHLDYITDDMDFSPAMVFTGVFTINGLDYRAYFDKHRQSARKVNKRDEGGTLTVGKFDVYVDVEDGIMKSFSIGLYEPPAPKAYSDKYKHPPVAAEKMVFADFNFKLAVIQELMYNKALLKPAFDLYEFVENYAGREIDIEEEGYGFIPEVTAYFEALEIDKKYAPEITAISQDGGDNIYGQLLRFWDGEDDTFNINNFDDIRHFPNLKRMNLFHADNLSEIAARLAEKGITVESI
ncbi:hypothetical protein SAMN04488128_106337 [Chitinophaga eiseniae]|uniref:Uncharacterized protein n=1 Tax=Chitinophaga eiseniae TaxID=634771 RepID=A0A1T4TUP9_9BACT|nr:hypothetical protein [Chitinophaga eiseniae]SKA44146.1 hypothetical protein SAMN04488128_106337 [Chitinophaga eiseniae]